MRKIFCVKENRARYELEGGGFSDFPVSHVQGGIVWPDFPNPGYFLILGKHRDADAKGKRPLYPVSEREEKTEKELFEKLTEDLARFECHVLFADEKQEGFWEALAKAIWHSSIKLLPAPYSEDVGYGKILLLESKGILRDIPHDSILASQLGRLEQERLDDFLKAPSFYAVTALRFVLGGFKKYENWGQSGRREVVTSG